MKRLLYELSESWKIAAAQMAANKTRSMLTALGVIIGIVAVTLMGTAINGISIGFDKSMSFLGDDVLYIEQWPWTRVSDWWNYRDRPKIRTEYADKINRAIAATPNSNLVIAVPTMSLVRSVKAGDNSVDNVFILGTTADYALISTIDCDQGRFFSGIESQDGAEVCVVGSDVASALFPANGALDKKILINGHTFKVIGSLAKQGSFLGIF
ncbi:MAG: ABC transporter permease, partial [Chthoniobacterales bacterium]